MRGLSQHCLCIPQAAKDIRKSHETLMDIFGRIESFFQRLEIYTQVPSTTEMLDTIIQVMVEVLTILGVATKEITQGRISEYQFSMSVSPVTERCSEKYAKRLIGKNDLEDALKNLDRLTQEESRMAIAENLRTTKQVERSSSPNLVDISYGALCTFQNANCGRASTNGSPHRIRQLTIILRVVLITRKMQRGSSKEIITRNGNQKVPSCGFTESVRPVPLFYPILPDDVSIL